jgi:hypothetical protein
VDARKGLQGSGATRRPVTERESNRLRDKSHGARLNYDLTPRQSTALPIKRRVSLITVAVRAPMIGSAQRPGGSYLAKLLINQ